ncbi:hypothetical protein [Pseudomonas asiatica]|uniref:Uncharacterized protein n=1 Tax=Pseudomonas asiatica TaxID=2219225 RepID=A0A9X4HUW9_9PSED|nr:hypothetical protein [Pseudomonas asiatica]MDD2106809.1 hypothetical protein [Pseudomonas asiatica]
MLIIATAIYQKYKAALLLKCFYRDKAAHERRTRMPNKNLHTFDLSMEAATKDGKPYLGDLYVVRELVGNLASDSLLRLVDISTGKLTAEQASEMDIKESRQLARVFLGQDPHYNGLQHWNEPGKIDDFVAAQANIIENDPEARIATLFILMIQDMYGAARLADEGYPEDDVQTAIDGSLESITAVLIGIPFDQLEELGLEEAQRLLPRR